MIDDLQRVAFDRNLFASRHSFPMDTFRNLRVQTWEDHFGRSLVTHVEGEFLKEFARHVHVSEHHKWPATWVDAVKERWAPEWLLKWWPVNYKTIDIEIEEPVYIICPHVDNKHFGPHVEFMISDDHRRRCDNVVLPIEGAKICGRQLYVGLPGDKEYLLKKIGWRLNDLIGFWNDTHYGDPANEPER